MPTPRSCPAIRCSAEMAESLRSPPVRNSGTLCGNIANGSPIGDSMPILIALGATVGCAAAIDAASCHSRSSISAIRRRRWSRASSSKPCTCRCRGRAASFASYKVSKRFDQDISAVCGAFAVEVEAGRISRRAHCVWRHGRDRRSARRAAEAALVGQPWSDSSSCVRCSRSRRTSRRSPTCARARGYRLQVAGNLLDAFISSIAAEPAPWRMPMTVDAMTEPMIAMPRTQTATSRAGATRAHDSAHLHVQRRGGLHRRHSAAGRTRCMPRSASARSRTARIRSIDLTRGTRGARCRRRRQRAATSPARTTTARCSHDDPIFAETLVQYAGQSLFAVAADLVRRGAPRRALARSRVRGAAARYSTSAPALAAASFVHCRRQTAARAAIRDSALAQAPHRLQGTRRDRRPGSLLSRRPDRRRACPRKTARCWSTARPSIRPRCSTSSRTRWACARTTWSCNAGAWAAASAARKASPRCSPARRRFSRAGPAGRSSCGWIATPT